MTQTPNFRNNRRTRIQSVIIYNELSDIIHGYIMSDGYVRADGTLTVDQSLEQERFVEWLYDHLRPIRTNIPISTKTRLDKRSNKITYSKCFNTRALLKEFHEMWYEPYTNEEGKTKYKKRLPNNINDFFSPTFISVWFAGDGTKMIDQRGAKFEVTAFSAEERQELKTLFKNKYNINVNIIRAGESRTGTPQWNLAINAPEYDKFRELITQIDLIPTIFPYKLHPMRHP